MPITVTCTCGGTYSLKDEFAGQWVRCPQCSTPIQVALLASPEMPRVDPAFARDKFLLRQKALTINEKYEVWDEQGHPILFIERPSHLLRNLGAAFAGIFAGLVVGIGLGVLAAVMPNETLALIVGILAALGGFAALLFVAIALSAKRHVNFYRDGTRREKLLEVLQDKKVAILNATYTLRDSAGQELARFSKNYLYNLIRKRWYCHTPDGAILTIAKEDSIILSLLRRFLGPLFGALRTNFILLDPAGATVLGEFNRKFTLLDRYVLDMSRDTQRAIDRRVALALGLLLDTGERR